jgi:Capsule assembly protein Wzi
VQTLADYGVFKGTITSWPLSWEALAVELSTAGDGESLPLSVQLTLDRVRKKAYHRTERKDVKFNYRLAVSDSPIAIRTFENTPREDFEIAGGYSWLSDFLSIDLDVALVDSPDDGQNWRLDGSEVGIEWGNYTIAISMMDRWWGPGWDGSLILSNNARPIPAFTFRRTQTKPFETKWLSWIGPWDFRVIWGEMESNREVANPRFFGMRFNFKPIPSLEIGLSRTAQWCGEGRPCDYYTFKDLLFGRDNVGDAGITPESEPGNQLAGYDFRWSNRWFGTPMAFYGQLIGEDEAGGFPSKFLAMGGLEFSGWLDSWNWSYRAYAEVAGTSCDFLSNDLFNCAYNHSIYKTGYRYRGKAVGHGADNDALIFSLGLVLLTQDQHEVRALIRSGDLNRGGPPDARHSLTPTPLTLFSLDLNYSRPFWRGIVDLGLGMEQLSDRIQDRSSNDFRAFLQWRSR